MPHITSIQLGDGTRVSAESSFLWPIHLGSLIKFIVMPQRTTQVVLSNNWLQTFGTTIICGDRMATCIAEPQMDNPRCHSMKSTPSNRREEINEVQNGLEHNLNDTSRPISRSIVEHNPYEKFDVPNSSPIIMNINSNHIIERNPVSYISQREKPKEIVRYFKSPNKHAFKDSPKKTKNYKCAAVAKSRFTHLC
uniref:Uncharacterized protein n=1 Tax=Glossina palpalis gambiensis TaxID=67801 RepID=A0A1B0B4L8_9MUSC